MAAVGDGHGDRLRIVEPAGTGGWRVRAPESVRASGVFGTIKEAEWRATEILLRSGGGIVDVRDPARGNRQFVVRPPKPKGKLYREPRGGQH
jgi:hypothetical protein